MVLTIDLKKLDAYHDQDLIMGLARRYLTQEDFDKCSAGGQSQTAFIGRYLRKLIHKFESPTEEIKMNNPIYYFLSDDEYEVPCLIENLLWKWKLELKGILNIYSPKITSICEGWFKQYHDYHWTSENTEFNQIFKLLQDNTAMPSGSNSQHLDFPTKWLRGIPQRECIYCKTPVSYEADDYYNYHFTCGHAAHIDNTPKYESNVIMLALPSCFDIITKKYSGMDRQMIVELGMGYYFNQNCYEFKSSILSSEEYKLAKEKSIQIIPIETFFLNYQQNIKGEKSNG